MSQTEDSASPPQIRLHCLNGQAAPAEVLNGWKRFAELPEDALMGFWGRLAPVLINPADASCSTRLETFCRENDIPLERGRAAAQALELLLGRAAALDIDIERFRQDLAALSGDPSRATELVLAQYAGVKAELRKHIVVETLSDHGKLLVGVNWRVDKLTASERGVQLDTPVVFLTLIYRDGGNLDRITLQLTPDGMKDLQRFCSRCES